MLRILLRNCLVTEYGECAFQISGALFQIPHSFKHQQTGLMKKSKAIDVLTQNTTPLPLKYCGGLQNANGHWCFNPKYLPLSTI